MEYLARNKFALCEEEVVVKTPIGLRLYRWEMIPPFTVDGIERKIMFKGGRFGQVEFSVMNNFNQVEKIMLEHLPKN